MHTLLEFLAGTAFYLAALFLYEVIKGFFTGAFKNKTLTQDAAQVGSEVSSTFGKIEAGVLFELNRLESEGKLVAGTIQKFVDAHILYVGGSARTTSVGQYVLPEPTPTPSRPPTT